MCTTAFNVSSCEEIGSIGDLRKTAHIVFPAQGVSVEELASIPDENCLCQCDVIGSLVFSGFKVWANPDVIPEFLFEPVEEGVRT